MRSPFDFLALADCSLAHPIEQAFHLVGRQSQLMGLGPKLPNVRQQFFLPLPQTQAAIAARLRSTDTHPLPSHQLDNAVAFQQRIGFGNRHGVDLKLLGQHPGRRQKVARRQPAGGDLLPHLIHQLPVERQTERRIDVKREWWCPCVSVY